MKISVDIKTELIYLQNKQCTIEILGYTQKKMRNTQVALDYLLMSHRRMKTFFLLLYCR